jgi:uncharacterized protein (DUF433 family)
MAHPDLYRGSEPRGIPLYSITDAAWNLAIPVATLRSWVIGRPYQKQDGPAYFEPLIKTPEESERRLSFSNLVEAHVLRALRTHHEVPIKHVRAALTFAESELGIERLLLRQDLLTHAGDVFLERYGKLVNLSKSGQLAVRRVLEEHLRRVEWTAGDPIPSRLFPFSHAPVLDTGKVILIDPRVAFGKPTIAGKGVTTAALVRRFNAGESLTDLARDYDLSERQVEAAILYERAA